MRKEERLEKKREKRLIRWLTKMHRDANSRPRPTLQDYIPPDLVWSGKDCGICGSEQLYHMRWDGRFCPNCNEWAETKCSDPECWFCPSRQARPLTNEELAQWQNGELTARTTRELKGI